MVSVGNAVKWTVSPGKVAVGVVRAVCDDGNNTGLPVKISGPAAKIEVIREGVPSGDFVGIKIGGLTVVDKVISTAAVRSVYKIHPATEDELKLINAMLPSGVSPRTAEDTVVVPFAIADNLVNRGLDRWGLDELQAMAKLAPGLPMLLDHDWSDVSKVWGKIFSAFYEHADKAPAAAMAAAGNAKLNKEIVKSEGHGQTVALAFARPNNPVVLAIMDGLVGKVSTGGFAFKDYECPLCNTSVRDDKCPHYLPDKRWGETHDVDPIFAPYVTRKGLVDLGEVSIVTIPNLPNAGVI